MIKLQHNQVWITKKNEHHLTIASTTSLTHALKPSNYALKRKTQYKNQPSKRPSSSTALFNNTSSANLLINFSFMGVARSQCRRTVWHKYASMGNAYEKHANRRWPEIKLTRPQCWIALATSNTSRLKRFELRAIVRFRIVRIERDNAALIIRVSGIVCFCHEYFCLGDVSDLIRFGFFFGGMVWWLLLLATTHEMIFNKKITLYCSNFFQKFFSICELFGLVLVSFLVGFW